MGERDQVLRRLVAAAALILLATSPVACAPGPPARTVLLVHGYRGSSSAFAPLQAGLRAAGIPSVVVDLPGEDNVANAAAIRDAAERVVRAGGPGTTVDIVAHSMGGLSSRWFAKFLGGSTPGGLPLLARYVSLGTPQYGLPATCDLDPANGGQMCPTGDFLAQLNDGDDTPGATVYTTIFSTDDGLVPTSASRLDGGACFVEVDGVNHFALRTDAAVLDLIVRALRGACPGTSQ